jgi:DNA-binding NarL/FixJ family response regulator
VTVAKQTVLVVDDDESVRNLLRDALERGGFTVREAVDADGALAAVQTSLPHLVVLEVVLPRVSGYELYKELRERLGEDLPIIFVSGERTDSYDRVAGLLLGAEDYIVKPFDPDEIVARVRRSLRTRRVVEPAQSNGTGAKLANLTPRESEILTLLTEGSSTAEIARDLVISQRTVGTHVQHILAKLGVSSRGQAVALAYREGLVSAGAEGNHRENTSR